MNGETVARYAVADDRTATGRYEQLRRHALGDTLESAAIAAGMVLLKRSGLRPWLEAGPPPAERSVRRGASSSATPHAGLDAELVSLMVAMVLTRVQEGQP